MRGCSALEIAIAWGSVSTGVPEPAGQAALAHSGMAVKVEPPPVNVKPEPQKVDPAPKKTGITSERLVARLRKIEASVAAKEAASGQRDNVLRQFIEQAKKQIRAANTEADRKDAWQFLGDIESQLR